MAVRVVDIRDDIDYVDDMRKRHKKLALEEAMANISRFAMQHEIEVASAEEGSRVSVDIPVKREYRLTYSFGEFGEQGQGVAQSNIPQEGEDEDSSEGDSQEVSVNEGDVAGEDDGKEGSGEDGQEEEDGGESQDSEQKELRIHRGMEVGRLNEDQQAGNRAMFGLGEGEGDGEEEMQDGEAGEGGEKAGREAGQDSFNADFPIDDLRDRLTQDFELPELDSRSISVLKTKKVSRPHGVSNRGPWSKIHRDRTLEEHDRRVVAEGEGGEEDDDTWRFEDFKFRHSEPDEQYISNLVIYFCRDSSGSITVEKLRKILALAIHWVRAGRKTHKQVVVEFISFDVEAKRRTEWEFLYRNSSGGTKISSGSEMILKLEKERYRREDWNSMIVFFTDGENENADMDIMKDSFKKCCEFAKFFAYYEVMATSSVVSAKAIEQLGEECDNFVAFEIKEDKDVPEAFTAVIEAIKVSNRKKEAVYA